MNELYFALLLCSKQVWNLELLIVESLLEFDTILSSVDTLGQGWLAPTFRILLFAIVPTFIEPAPSALFQNYLLPTSSISTGNDFTNCYTLRKLLALCLPMCTDSYMGTTSNIENMLKRGSVTWWMWRSYSINEYSHIGGCILKIYLVSTFPWLILFQRWKLYEMTNWALPLNLNTLFVAVVLRGVLRVNLPQGSWRWSFLQHWPKIQASLPS